MALPHTNLTNNSTYVAEQNEACTLDFFCACNVSWTFCYFLKLYTLVFKFQHLHAHTCIHYIPA
jgi:hypothetical protein